MASLSKLFFQRCGDAVLFSAGDVHACGPDAVAIALDGVDRTRILPSAFAGVGSTASFGATSPSVGVLPSTAGFGATSPPAAGLLSTGGFGATFAVTGSSDGFGKVGAGVAATSVKS